MRGDAAEGIKIEMRKSNGALVDPGVDEASQSDSG